MKKVKKVLGYIAIGLVGAAAGAMIVSPETRQEVFSKVKGAGSWVAGKFSKKDENTCGDEVDPEVEDKKPESNSSDRKSKWGGYYKKPRYNNKNN